MSVLTIAQKLFRIWVTTFTTILHEFRHHMQRAAIVASMAICVGGGLTSWFYGMLVNNDLFIYAIPLAFAAMGFMAHHYLEWDAKRYERGNLPGILLAVQALEHTWIAWTLGLQRTTRNNLRRLHKEIQKNAPLLLEELGQDQEVVEIDAR